MQADIAIIVVAFNRPKALSRLLSSLRNACYEGYNNITLIISVDYSGANECADLGNNFTWPHGTKIIIQHDKNLGLKKHILQCGDLSSEHDAIIVLEDDLFVSAAFYDYAQQAFSFYKDDANIAGIGLYNYRFNEVAFCPFEPLADGYDNYFLQVPCSSGQLWTKKQWQLYKDYSGAERPKEDLLPAAVAAWPSATSWKKLFYYYLLVTNRYFVYPCISLTTNFGDTGQHHDNEMLVWQAPLLMNRKAFLFSKLNTSTSVYDAFFELDAKAFNKLTNQRLDVCIDVNGTKLLSQINNEYLLSSKKCKQPIKKYALNLYPYINNALMGMGDTAIHSNFFSLGTRDSFIDALNTDIRTVDVKRVFYNTDMLITTGKNEVYRSKEYKTGKAILKPLLFLKRLLKFAK
jgi:hypothetical protein